MLDGRLVSGHLGKHLLQDGLVRSDKRVGSGAVCERVEQLVVHAPGHREMGTEYDLRCHLPNLLEASGEHATVDLVQPGRIDRRPQHLALSQLLRSDIGCALGWTLHQRPEAV